jgi:hypothetical protein
MSHIRREPGAPPGALAKGGVSVSSCAQSHRVTLSMQKFNVGPNMTEEELTWLSNELDKCRQKEQRTSAAARCSCGRVTAGGRAEALDDYYNKRQVHLRKLLEAKRRS